MFVESHPNGHEDFDDEPAMALRSMLIEEEEEHFIAGFLRPLRPVEQMEAHRRSNPDDEGSNPSGATIGPYTLTKGW